VSVPVVGLLHPGRMGAAVAAQARRGGATVLWCPEGRSEASVGRAETAGLTACADLTQLCQQAEVILSICPPAAAESVATDVAATGFRGIYVEANAINPARYHHIAHCLDGGGSVIDAAIIGPPPTDGRETVLYLAGPAPMVRPVIDVFDGSTVRTIRLAQEPPAASALKMAYAGYQKASRVLAAIAHALARRYDVTGPLLAEAARTSHTPLADPDFAATVAARAWRWAPELRDVAATLTDNGLPPDLAVATASVLGCWEGDKDNDILTPAEALERLSHGHQVGSGAQGIDAQRRTTSGGID
jgi:3-hydroxyisobutyrate dehydrogenase-like beta-hydroxyacid dehydrogenase